jgi:alkyldihydroxyacetonephosphate synthase
VEACRQLAQSQLYPTNSRLVDPLEALANGLGDGMNTVLILGYESPVHPVDGLLNAALQICSSCGGIQRPVDTTHESVPTNKADDWKHSFLLAPYLRDEMILQGLVVETFETCTTWNNFAHFHQEIKKNVMQAIAEHCGSGMVTCRFTHLYPDGPAPYYTVVAQGKPGKQLEQWDAIKKAASDTINAKGGTITHHHAVGRDHQPYFAREQSPEILTLLRKMKDHFDPDGLLNEGVLIG